MFGFGPRKQPSVDGNVLERCHPATGVSLLLHQELGLGELLEEEARGRRGKVDRLIHRHARPVFYALFARDVSPETWCQPGLSIRVRETRGLERPDRQSRIPSASTWR